jgi:alkylated DNA repair dioxygenase AlkB
MFASQPRSSWLPEGLRYESEVVTRDQERDLLARIRALPFRAFEFRGYEGKCRVVSFGWRYDFTSRRLDPADDIPEFLFELRRRASAFAGVPASALQQASVIEYGPGAGIGWHRDKPVFCEVVGFSLLAPCLFRLRKGWDGGWERVKLALAPRSAYLLSGRARTEWEHSIPPVTALRYSVTFRTLASPRAARWETAPRAR